MPKPNSDFVAIGNLLKKNGAGDSCYAISFNPEIDGRHLPLEEALEKRLDTVYHLLSCVSLTNWHILRLNRGLVHPQDLLFENEPIFFN